MKLNYDPRSGSGNYAGRVFISNLFANVSRAISGKLRWDVVPSRNKREGRFLRHRWPPFKD